MITLRQTSDIDELMKWRCEVIETVFGVSPNEVLMIENRKYYESHVPEGSHIAFIADYDGTEVGCGGVCFSEELPSPDNLTGRCAYLMNIYVKPGFREHGAAHAIVKRLLAEAMNRNCRKIYLETTPEGRNVYTSLGFKDLPDMMKYYNKID